MHDVTHSKQSILAQHASCACTQARNTARYLTQKYDSELAPSGLKITQFNPLSILLAGPQTMSALAGDVGIDRTTLNRVLMPLERDGYVVTMDGKDARTRVIELTTKGRHATLQALDLWKQAQARYAPAQVGSEVYTQTTQAITKE